MLQDIGLGASEVSIQPRTNIQFGAVTPSNLRVAEFYVPADHHSHRVPTAADIVLVGTPFSVMATGMPLSIEDVSCDFSR